MPAWIVAIVAGLLVVGAQKVVAHRHKTHEPQAQVLKIDGGSYERLA